MISVCIATYNGAHSIKEQLTSILSQLGPEDEVIVSDDGSTDRTLEIVRNLSSPIVKIVEGPATGSLIDNFEHALKHASGDYIFLSDQDDKWLPNKVSIAMEHFTQGYNCIISDCIVTDQSWNVTSPSFYQTLGKRNSRWFNLLVRNAYLGCCMAFDRSVLNRSLPFPPNIPMHDIWIGNVASFTGKVAFIDDKLILFRRHDSNNSSTASRSPYKWQDKLRFRWQTAYPLLLRILHLQ